MGNPASARVSVVVAAREPLGRAIQHALTAGGHFVAGSCSTIADTLTAVRLSHPDVCVVDRDLPGGGLAAIAALAGHGRRPRVIVLGGVTKAEMRAARLAGAAECLPETVDPAKLAAAVSATAGKKSGKE